MKKWLNFEKRCKKFTQEIGSNCSTTIFYLQRENQNTVKFNLIVFFIKIVKQLCKKGEKKFRGKNELKKKQIFW